MTRTRFDALPRSERADALDTAVETLRQVIAAAGGQMDRRELTVTAARAAGLSVADMPLVLSHGKNRQIIVTADDPTQIRTVA